MYKVDIIGSSHAVVDSRENHHVEFLFLLYQGIYKPVGTCRVDIVVHIACM